MADVCKFCGQETVENGLCNCDGAVAERTATSSQPNMASAVDTAVSDTAENAVQSIGETLSPPVTTVETMAPQAVPSAPPIPQGYVAPVQPVGTSQPPTPPHPQPSYTQQQYVPPQQPPAVVPYQPPTQPPLQPQQSPQGYGYQQPGQAGYQPPMPGQQPPTQFQMPSQITEAASAVSSTFMELIKNPLGAAKAGDITTANSWVLLGIFAVSYILYLFFKGLRYFGFSSLSGTANFIFPIFIVAVAVALLFLALVLSCNFAKVPSVSSKSIFGLIAIASIPLTVGYLVNMVLALLFGGISIGSTLITLVRLFTQILFILIIEHGMSDKIKNNTHRLLAVGISLAVFLGTMTLMSGFLDNLMMARGSMNMFWDMFGY